MKIFARTLGAIGLCLLSSALYGYGKYATCADQVRAHYRWAVAGQFGLIPAHLASFGWTFLGMQGAINSTIHLKKYSKLLKAATLEYSNRGTPESAAVITKAFDFVFWEDKEERIKIEMTNAQLFERDRKQVKPMRYQKEDIVSILNLLNTEPVLREECLRFQFVDTMRLPFFTSEESFKTFEEFIKLKL